MNTNYTLQTARELLSTFLAPLHNISYDISHSCNIAHKLIAKQVILQTTASTNADFQQHRIIVDGSWSSVNDNTGLAWVCFDKDNKVIHEEATLGPSMLAPQQTEADAVL